MTAAAQPICINEGRPWGLATLWLLGLGPFFFLSYGFANWFTGLRSDVPSLVFSWEHHIPFLAWTIVPYWSTDFFYAGSLFICRSRNEVNTHAKRLLAIQVLSVAGFLLFPLRYSFHRPETTGMARLLFDALMDFDRPFNQAPSLHLGLITILWAKYRQHLSGATRWWMCGWFVLMGVSTLTTYQHHFIDLPTGIWAGLLCLVLFPEKSPARTRPSVDSRKYLLGSLYLSGSAVLIFSIWWLGGAAWILLWPAGSLGIVGVIYWIGRPELFRKTNGALMPPMTVLLAPYLAGAWINSRLHTRGQPAVQEIADGVWLGRLPTRAEREVLGFASVVDVTAELPIDTKGVVYRGVPMLDLLPPTPDQLNTVAESIAALDEQRPTLVCCALGYSRSAAAVAAWLFATGRSVSVAESLQLIASRRPQVVIGQALRQRLEEWSEQR